MKTKGYFHYPVMMNLNTISVHKKREQQTVRWQISSYNISNMYSCKLLVWKIKYCSKLDGEDLQLKCTDFASFLLAKTTVSTILFDLKQKTVSTKDRNSFNTIILQLFLLSTSLHKSYAFHTGGISKEIYNCSGKFWGSKFEKGWIKLMWFNY